MERIRVTTGSGAYDVTVGSGLLPEILSELGGKSVFVVTDENVFAHYEAAVRKMSADFLVLPAGEQSKSFATCERVCEELCARGFSRDTLLVAFGGGVIGDLTGFIAAVYMRGVAYVQIPTTLLSMVDSSVGGKTAVNLGTHKNIVGSFLQPKAVFADVDFLQTLPEREVRCGVGEIVKTAFLDRDILAFTEENIEKLLKNDTKTNQQAIVSCVKFKAEVVKADERETLGIRKQLNAGHTVGHALESLALGLRSHGEFVLDGLYFETLLAEQENACTKEYASRMKKLVLSALSGKTPILPSAAAVAEAAVSDKKNKDGKISVMLPIAEGEVREKLFEKEELCARLQGEER